MPRPRKILVPPVLIQCSCEENALEFELANGGFHVIIDDDPDVRAIIEGDPGQYKFIAKKLRNNQYYAFRFEPRTGKRESLARLIIGLSTGDTRQISYKQRDDGIMDLRKVNMLVLNDTDRVFGEGQPKKGPEKVKGIYKVVEGFVAAWISTVPGAGVPFENPDGVRRWYHRKTFKFANFPDEEATHNAAIQFRIAHPDS